jgi:hypothetical protein
VKAAAIISPLGSARRVVGVTLGGRDVCLWPIHSWSVRIGTPAVAIIVPHVQRFLGQRNRAGKPAMPYAAAMSTAVML